jgi:quercetin dioxygenase-like cupin family protein
LVILLVILTVGALHHRGRTDFSKAQTATVVGIYTGSDGQSHLEELDLASHPELTELLATKGIVFRTAQPGHFSDWHNAPRRQFVITVSGEAEIGLGDGSVHRFGPGHVNLVEDLTGKGHTTRVVGNQPRVTATVHLADT